MNVVRQISADAASNAKRILIINVTRIGDTVLATPALRAIAKFFPNARVTCLGHPKRVEVLQHLPYLAKTGGITKKSATFRGWKDTLFGQAYDWAFVWGNDRALIEYAKRKAKYVVAQRQPEGAPGKELHSTIEMPPQNSIHAVAWYLALPKAVGIPADGYRLDYRISNAEMDWSANRLRADGILAADRLLLIGMQVASFATKSYRDWPIKHFVELARRTIESYPNIRFVLFGSAEDQSRIDVLLQSLPKGSAFSYAGKLSLRETVAIMGQLDAYVGVDTGPTHLFSALQKPMVVLYHPSLPSALYRPLQHSSLHAIDHPLAVPGASKEIEIGDISVETVSDALRDAIEGIESKNSGLPSPGIDLGAAYYPGDPPQ
jgi:heptosyltransferase-3